MADGNNNDFLSAVQEDHKIREPLEHTAANFERPGVVFQWTKTFRRAFDAVERSLQLEQEFIAQTKSLRIVPDRYLGGFKLRLRQSFEVHEDTFPARYCSSRSRMRSIAVSPASASISPRS